MISADGNDAVVGDDERLEGGVAGLVQLVDERLDGTAAAGARHLLRQRRHQVFEGDHERGRNLVRGHGLVLLQKRLTLEAVVVQLALGVLAAVAGMGMRHQG